MLADTGTPWLACIRPSSTGSLRLFCLPYAGGGASVFRNWGELLPSGVEAYAVQLPGRESRIAEPFPASVAVLVNALSHALLPWLDRPFVLFGHSMGALLALELARALRRDGSPQPQHLFVAAYRAPQLPDPHPLLHDLSDRELVEKLEQLDGTRPGVFANPELRALFMPLLRADFNLCADYEYYDEDPLDCGLSVYAGRYDSRVDVKSLAAWSVHTRREFDLQQFPGDHFFLHEARTQVVQAISKRITGF